MWDACDPRADFDLPSGLAHQLRRCKAVVVHFGGKDRVEPGLFGGARDCPDLGGAPPDTRDDPQPQSIRHAGIP